MISDILTVFIHPYPRTLSHTCLNTSDLSSLCAGQVSRIWPWTWRRTAGKGRESLPGGSTSALILWPGWIGSLDFGVTEP